MSDEFVTPLVDRNAVILTQQTPTFDFAAPSVDPEQLAHQLAQTIIANNGLGLAAPQIGIPVRAFAIKAAPIIVCFNPRIVDFSEKQVYLDEGCLSFPYLFIKIKRPEAIKVRYQQPNGETITQKFQGITARVFQHELDHLNGITFDKRANKIHLERGRNAARRTKKLAGQ